MAAAIRLTAKTDEETGPVRKRAIGRQIMKT